jgi:hypothetical protein
VLSAIITTPIVGVRVCDPNKQPQTSSKNSPLQTWKDCADFVGKIVEIWGIVIGGTWVLWKFGLFREEKLWIQFDIDANLYELKPGTQDKKTTLTTFSWDKKGTRINCPNQSCSQAVEVLLKFTNKGKTRFRLFNAQIAINTILDCNKLKCDEDEGHLKLQRVFTSGNIVEKMTVQKTLLPWLLPSSVNLCFDLKRTSFYYIEPDVEQTIHFLAIIPEPQGLLQVIGEFSLEQERIFPEKKTGTQGLYPHKAVRTYQIKDGRLVKDQQDSSA